MDSEVYLPEHNSRFAKPAAVAEKPFVAADAPALRETLCSEEQRVVGRDNTVAYEGCCRRAARAHYVKASVKVCEYPDGTLAIFHGPRRLARYDRDDHEIAAPTNPAWPRAQRRQGAAWTAIPALSRALRGARRKASRRPSVFLLAMPS